MRIKTIFDQLFHGNYPVLSEQILSELDLKRLAALILNSEKYSELLKKLIENIPLQDKVFDWNVGSILQHLDIRQIIKVLTEIDQSQLYDSIGLTWVLGEFKNSDRIIVDFLRKALNFAKNSEAWWRAAFSLEMIGVEDAVNTLKMSLKHTHLNSLTYYLRNIDDKKSLIGILVLSNVDNIEEEIYPAVKKNFLKSNHLEVIINCCWLIGRLKLIDDQIYNKLLSLISSNDYELKYYTFFALQNNATPTLRSVMEQSLINQDPLIRKMAARSILSIGDEQSLPVLMEALFKEDQDAVVAEISKAIYYLKNPIGHNKILIEVKSRKNENGMISDESDKWYTDPAIYNVFSEAEDPENICFDLIQKRLEGMKAVNPIDLACGTGRIAWQILDNIKFSGTLFLVDLSEKMVNFVGKTIKRERKYTSPIKVIKSSIINLSKTMKVKSNFIISSFGFPSKLSNKNLCLEELKTVHSLLLDNGLFFTIGWDETFNDELNMMWFKYIPDEICANDFEEWRRKRAERIGSPRNCNLAWLKKSIYAPLQFTSLKETVQVMGYLFGRDATQYVVRTGKTDWSMSLGITCNTKEEIAKIIENYERN